MRRAQPAIGLKAKGYHHFAWIVLGLAVLVAAAGGDVATAGADSPGQVAGRDATAVKPKAGPALAAPPALVEPGDGPVEDAAGDESEPVLVAETAEEDDRGHPPLPGEAKTGPQQFRPAAAPRPSQADLDRLVASSRMRSGGVDQGDEIRRSS